MYLGIDLGTSELKVVLLADDHRVVAGASEPIATSRPHPLWSEQDPASWWSALDAALLRLRESHPAALAAVRAIAPAGQMHGAVLLDPADAVLRPAILWNDGRSARQCESLEAALPSLRALAGNAAMPGFTAPKLLWVREHEPSVFARTARVLLPKDWLRLGLTGEHVSEMSDASGTLWLDVGRRAWSDALLAACHLGRDQMPRLVEGSEPSGALRPALAARWGMRSGIVVAGGGGDNAASAIGVGAVRPNQGFVSLGTSGVCLLVSERFTPNAAAAVHAFCHALPGRWHQMSVMLSAASALRWACGVLGEASEAALLDRVASLSAEQRARAPLFLPYLSGDRTPHNDADAQGVLFGLTHDHDAAAVGYAVLEGVAFSLLDGWLSLAADRRDVRALALIGGGARSDLWAQMLASLLGVVMQRSEAANAGAIGAARLAWLADGGSEAEVCSVAPVRRDFVPDRAEAARLSPRHDRFRNLYAALRSQFGASRAATADAGSAAPRPMSP
ncbi:MAG TPA: xylulokinase [Caldimonas sp.]|nr:xylulokinase [Caldimonas sp.]